MLHPNEQVEDLSKLSTVQRLVRGISAEDLIANQAQLMNLPKSENNIATFPFLTKTLIFKFLNDRCLTFETKLDQMLRDSEKSSDNVMEVFRFPYVTYLTNN
jgi:hypothetical protein